MKNNLIALVLVCAMLVPLTACGGMKGAQEEKDPDRSVPGAVSGEQGGYVGADVPGGSEGSNIYGDIPGNPQRSAPGTGESNPYLRDGRYGADGNGRVDGRDSTDTRDLTGRARDMIRDAGDTLKDMGRDVRDAVSGQ